MTDDADAFTDSCDECSSPSFGSISSSDEEEALLLLLTLETLNKKTGDKKRAWVKDVNARNESTEYHRLCRELDSHEDRFFWYFNMSRDSFEEIHKLVTPCIFKMDTNYRKSISTRERLAICLRYIRTGDGFLTISNAFRIGRSTVSMIIEEVSSALWKSLQPTYMPIPTEEIWKKSASGYQEMWNFPNCVGSIDGKRVEVKCNKNRLFLLAIVDPFYKFTMVDIASYDRRSDSNIYENSEFYREYIDGKCLLPPKPLPGTDDPVPHVLIGNEAFVLKPYLMRPFAKNLALKSSRKQCYNSKHCQVHSVVESTFGMLTEKWEVFHKPLECHFEKAIHVVKAACCLHNYGRAKHGHMSQVSNNANISNQYANALKPIRHTNKRSKCEAFLVRESFVSYFNRKTTQL